MAYGGNPSTDTSDALRLRVFDTSTSTGSELLSDGEVTFFLNNAPNGLYAAADAAAALAAKFSGNTVSEKKVGDLSLKIGAGDPAATYRALSDELRYQAALSVKGFSGGISVSDKDTQRSDSDWNQPDVSIGLHDNPTARSTSTGSF